MKPFIFDTTLLAVDCTPKAHLALRAIEKSLEQCEFPKVKLLTDNMALKYAVKIPKIEGLEGYSKFCIRNLTRYVDTKYCLMVQADGFLINGAAWTDEFFHYDWIGAPWNPSGIVGNGGFSWRSKKLLDVCYYLQTGDSEHPEDEWISVRHRGAIEQMGVKIAPIEVARKFSFEGRTYVGSEWNGVPNQHNGALGFHSWLTNLPKRVDRPKIYHGSGDAGDLIYGAATMRALGGGVLFISPDNRHPYPLNSRWARTGGDPEWVNNLKPLLEAQDYIERVSFTHGTPFSTDYDLNKFRLPWKSRTSDDFKSIFKLHADAFNLTIPEDQPWLTVSNPITVPGRPVLVNRTQRYHNDSVRWDLLVKKYHSQMIFIGTDQEAELFQGLAYPLKVPHYKTNNLLNVAQYVAGAKLFIGNQSAALAIAHGLGQRVICECWPANSNCELNRPGKAIYWKSGEVEIPKEWL